jgi:hypothetical protein
MRQFLRRAASMHQLNHPATQLRWVRSSCPGHRGAKQYPQNADYVVLQDPRRQSFLRRARIADYLASYFPAQNSSLELTRDRSEATH